jgi:hypothetical protein
MGSEVLAELDNQSIAWIDKKINSKMLPLAASRYRASSATNQAMVRV